MTLSNKVVFRASIPALESAIKIHGEGGGRLLLDVPESEMGAFIPVIAMRGKNIEVTINVETAKK